MISNKAALQMLLLHAASAGRGELLFGEGLERLKKILPAFVDPVELAHFPEMYLEFPLIGVPFLDAEVLYLKIPENARIASPLAAGTEQMPAWLAQAKNKYPDITGGFEIDTQLPPVSAAVCFQPRQHTELAAEFCEIIGETRYGQLYTEMAGRMPEGWKLSYFGLFKNRPGSPLRIGGYMDREQIASCAGDPEELTRLFAAAGFTAWDEPMIREICSVLAVSPERADFQFDVYPDGSVGDGFAIDIAFALQQPEAVKASFYGRSGSGAAYMELLRKWGIADERWKKALEAVFSGALPLTEGAVTFRMFPQWFKVRWKGKKLQPAKMYLHAKAGYIHP